MVDEEALLAQFTAQFDQQTDDSDTTQADSNDSDNIPAFDAPTDSCKGWMRYSPAMPRPARPHPTWNRP